MKLFTQLKLEVFRVFRNPYFIFWTLFMPILFYFVFTNIVTAETTDQDVWAAHYLMSMTTFSVMGSCIMIFGIRLVQENSEGWSTFIKLTPYPTWAYFFSKMFAQTVVHVCSIIIIFLAGYIINSVTLTLSQWIFSALWIILGSIPFLAIGSIVGTIRKVETASGISNFFYLVLAILGGMWMPLYLFPDLLQSIGKWLPSYHYGNGAWEIIRGNSPDWQNIMSLIAYLILFMLLAITIRKKQQIS
ncbi:ABC transporter permease [Sediminibacillus sp. JSM 1682029]|uniref:ABC transporter permease n=1 Tax=Sediminibacillus sp. JSM 1682029 TaxID=3229857 RepID=UPI0035249412